MLQVSDLRVSYGGVPALHGISLDVGENEYVGVVGPNGAGKTTLLKAISGTVATASGRVAFDGNDLDGMGGHARTDIGIVHVPQGRRIFSGLTVRENLQMGAYRRGARGRFEERLELVLELFPELPKRLDDDGAALSGGQQQMLAIGRGLMAAPRLLMLDEPSMGLAPIINEGIFDALERLRELGEMSVLLVEQHAREALELCDRAYVIESGEVVVEGPTAELVGNDAVVDAYLGGG